MILSDGLKVVVGAAIFLSAPAAVPSVTELTVTAAGAGAGSAGGMGAGSAGAGAGVTATGSSFFLQPTTASEANSAAARTYWVRLRINMESLLEMLAVIKSDTARCGPRNQSSIEGIFRTWPGW